MIKQPIALQIMLLHHYISVERGTGGENHCKGIFSMSSASSQRIGRTYSREHSLACIWLTPTEMCINLLQDEMCFFSGQLPELHNMSFIKSVMRNQELTDSSFYSINLTQMQYIVITVQVDWISCEISKCLFYSILCCVCIALLLPFSRWEHTGMQKAGGLLKDMRICLQCS